VYCSVSGEVGQSVRSKKREYQSVDSLDYNMLLSYATNGSDHDYHCLSWLTVVGTV